jgi:hypothetical protein
MIPLMCLIPKPVTTLPIANSGMFDGKRCQCLLNFTIVFRISFVLVSGSGQFYQFARLSIT